MKKGIVITGATGFVGKKLCLALIQKGYELKIITRNKIKGQKTLPLPATFYEWSELSDALENSHAVIHLAGEPVAEKRWNSQVKNKIKQSRIDSTSKISEALSKCSHPPKIFIGTSAIGIYGNRDNELLSEESSKGSDFLSEVCQAWEKSYKFQHRLAILRVGIVLGNGGALAKMLPPFRFGVGGQLGNGNQWMSWIHIDDLVGLYLHALENDHVQGPINAVAPNPVTNSVFSKTLAKALGRPLFLPVPTLAIKAMFGEMSQVLLGSQNVSAKKALGFGYQYKFSELQFALQNILTFNQNKGVYQFEAFHWVPRPKKEVFTFFSEAKNLETITPEWLNFHIDKMSSPEIAQGTLIDYKLKIKGVPLHWKTLIENWNPGESFVDEQLKGPYKLWHHTHSFYDCEEGTLMCDQVLYKLPFGILGDLVRMMWVQFDIQKIFEFRTKKIEEVFR